MNNVDSLISLPERFGHHWIRSLEKRKTPMPYALVWLFILISLGGLISGYFRNSGLCYSSSALYAFWAYSLVTQEAAWRRITELKANITDPHANHSIRDANKK